MKQIRRRLTYANVMSSIAVFLVLGGATAIAAKKIGKNDLKANAVTTAKIKKNAVTASKLKNSAVTTNKIKNEAVTGAKVNESSLGQVPSAVNAVSANSLVGQTPFFIRLGFGQSQTIASHGSVSLIASCEQTGGNDHAVIHMATTENGAVAEAEDSYDGSSPTDFLNADTAAADREFVENSVASGQTDVDSEIDYGFLIGPDNKMLTTNSEGIALGLNYGQPGCLFGGVINAVG